MSMPDTENMAKYFCPSCSPEIDQLKDMNTVQYCEAHKPPMKGVDDSEEYQGYLGNTEAGGEDNRRFCALVHRDTQEAEVRPTQTTRKPQETPGVTMRDAVTAFLIGLVFWSVMAMVLLMLP